MLFSVLVIEEAIRLEELGNSNLALAIHIYKVGWLMWLVQGSIGNLNIQCCIKWGGLELKGHLSKFEF